MSNFNFKLSKILREFDDEYADLEDEDEFDNDTPRPQILVGAMQIGGITAELYRGDTNELRLNGLTRNDNGFYELAEKCWVSAGYNETSDTVAWKRRIGRSTPDRHNWMWRFIDDLLELLGHEFGDGYEIN